MSLGRHRNYAESRSFSEAAFGAAPLVPWVAADVLDPPWMGSALSGHVNINHTGRVKPIDHTSAHVPGLYSLDGLAYESIMLGSFRIFRCKKHYAGCDEMYYKNGTLKSPEWAVRTRTFLSPAAFSHRWRSVLHAGQPAGLQP